MLCTGNKHEKAQFAAYLDTTSWRRIIGASAIIVFAVVMCASFPALVASTTAAADADAEETRRLFAEWQAALATAASNVHAMSAALAAFASPNAVAPMNASKPISEQIIITNPAAFDRLCHGIVPKLPGLSMMGLSPGGVVSQIFPPSPSVIGYSMMTDPRYSGVIPVLIESSQRYGGASMNNPIVSGPVQLGGRNGWSLVTWYPVFVSSNTSMETFWGSSFIMMDLLAMLKALGIMQLSEQDAFFANENNSRVVEDYDSQRMAHRKMHFVFWHTQTVGGSAESLPIVMFDSGVADPLQLIADATQYTMLLPFSERGKRVYLSIYPDGGPVSYNVPVSLAIATLVTALASAIVTLFGLQFALMAHFRRRHRFVPKKRAERAFVAAIALRGAQPIADRAPVEASRIFAEFASASTAKATLHSCYPICQIGDRTVYIVSRDPSALVRCCRDIVTSVAVRGSMTINGFKENGESDGDGGGGGNSDDEGDVSSSDIAPKASRQSKKKHRSIVAKRSSSVKQRPNRAVIGESKTEVSDVAPSTINANTKRGGHKSDLRIVTTVAGDHSDSSGGGRVKIASVHSGFGRAGSKFAVNGTTTHNVPTMSSPAGGPKSSDNFQHRRRASIDDAVSVLSDGTEKSVSHHVEQRQDTSKTGKGNAAEASSSPIKVLRGIKSSSAAFKMTQSFSPKNSPRNHDQDDLSKPQQVESRAGLGAGEGGGGGGGATAFGNGPDSSLIFHLSTSTHHLDSTAATLRRQTQQSCSEGNINISVTRHSTTAVSSSFVNFNSCRPCAIMGTFSLPTVAAFDAMRNCYFVGSTVDIAKLCGALDKLKSGEIGWTDAFEYFAYRGDDAVELNDDANGNRDKAEMAAKTNSARQFENKSGKTQSKVVNECRELEMDAVTTAILQESAANGGAADTKQQQNASGKAKYQSILHVCSMVAETGEERDEEDPPVAMAALADMYIKKWAALASSSHGNRRNNKKGGSQKHSSDSGGEAHDGSTTGGGSSSNKSGEVTTVTCNAAILHIAVGGEAMAAIDAVRRTVAEHKGAVVSAHESTIVAAFNLLTPAPQPLVKASDCVLKLRLRLKDVPFVCSLSFGKVAALVSEGMTMCTGETVAIGRLLLQRAIAENAVNLSDALENTPPWMSFSARAAVASGPQNALSQACPAATATAAALTLHLADDDTSDAAAKAAAVAGDTTVDWWRRFPAESAKGYVLRLAYDASAAAPMAWCDPSINNNADHSGSSGSPLGNMHPTAKGSRPASNAASSNNGSGSHGENSNANVNGLCLLYCFNDISTTHDCEAIGIVVLGRKPKVLYRLSGRHDSDIRRRKADKKRNGLAIDDDEWMYQVQLAEDQSPFAAINKAFTRLSAGGGNESESLREVLDLVGKKRREGRASPSLLAFLFQHQQAQQQQQVCPELLSAPAVHGSHTLPCNLLLPRAENDDAAEPVSFLIPPGEVPPPASEIPTGQCADVVASPMVVSRGEGANHHSFSFATFGAVQSDSDADAEKYNRKLAYQEEVAKEAAEQ